MSYILDALDKAEQDRQYTKVPNLKTARITPVAANRFQPGVWVTLIVFVSLSLLLFFYPGRDNSWQSVPVDTNIETKSRSTVTDMPISVEDVPKRNAQTELEADAATKSRMRMVPVKLQPEPTSYIPDIPGAGSPMGIEQNEEILTINELPLSVQHKLPDLTFSTHIYASDAAWRMVGINGKNRIVGDIIEGNLVLQAITEDGVILGYEGYSFSMSVVKNWTSE